jgi:ribosomal protein S18 acetylase RimI-like enzyme
MTDLLNRLMGETPVSSVPGVATQAIAIRPARRDDAEHIARLTNIAGEDIPKHQWLQAISPSGNWLRAGTQRAARDEGNFSWRNAWIAEYCGEVSGMLLGYPLPDPYPLEDIATVPRIVRPLVELEAEAPGSWYVNALATYPTFRDRGIGSALLATAEQQARKGGCRTLSLIVAEHNEGAVVLYARNGYCVAGRRGIVPFQGFRHTGEWLLLRKSLRD